MTVTARCRDGQAAFQQSFAVNALCVVRDDLVLRTGVTDSRFLPLLMALAAKPGDIDGENGRLWIRPPLHFVCAMALLAGGPVRVVVGDQPSVHAPQKLRTHLRVTGGAIDFLDNCLTGTMPRRVHAGMTLTARDFLMHRVGKWVSLDGERPPVIGSAD